MLLTTCPNCGAKFKVAPEQLNVRQGRVMCGRCRHVFNAFEALKRIEDTDVGEPIDYSLVDSTQASDAPPQSPSAAVVIDEADSPAPTDTQPDDGVKDAVSIDTTVPAETSLVDNVEVGDLRDNEAFDSYEEASRKLEQVEQIAPPVDELYEATSAAASHRVGSGVEPPPLQTEAEAAAPDVPMATGNPLIGGALPRQSAPSRAWAWLAVLAGAVLLGQTIYFFRSQIVQQYPQLRPTLAAACEPIGCTVSWGRDQTLIKIESSDLIEPPGRPGKILLTATLANRAPTKQDYPALEVKLTDANNAVLASRILMPAEYLGRTPGGEEGLAPNVELYINLNLELVGKSPASGYGLRAFYP